MEEKDKKIRELKEKLPKCPYCAFEKVYKNGKLEIKAGKEVENRQIRPIWDKESCYEKYGIIAFP